MSDEGKLWLGTGSGSIYLFSVVAGVANPSQRVVALAKQAGIEHSSKFRDRVGSGGLLSSVVEGEAEENHLERRRKTNFGYTFRGGTRNRSGASSPGVYKLVFVENHQSYPNSTEPVRTLLSIRLVLHWCACVHVQHCHWCSYTAAKSVWSVVSTVQQTGSMVFSSGLEKTLLMR